MECKKCGTNLQENAMFCGVCGTKVEKQPNTCGKCGGEVSEKAKFCRHCGEVVGGQIAATVEQNSAPSETSIQTPVESVPPAISKEALSEKNKKMIKTGIIGLAVIAVLLFAVTQFKNRPTASASNDLNLMFFKSDDDKFYAKSSGKKEYILKGTGVHQVLVSKDGKKIYALDEDQTLYLQEGNKAPEKIASDVKWMMISASGNTVAFMKEQDSTYGMGTLYVKSGQSAPQKVSSEDCVPDTVSISENGKYVAFTEVDGDFYDEDGIRHYLYPVGKEKIKGGKQISIGVDNKGTILAMNLDQDLYIIKKGKDSNKISSEVETIIANKDFSKILVLDQIGNLYECKGSNKEKIEGNVDYTSYIKGAVRSEDGMFYQTETKELDIIFSKNGRLYMKCDGKESESIANGNISEFQISKDFKNIAYVSDGGLHIKRINNGKIKVEEKIDTRVTGVNMDKTGSHIVYGKEGDLYYLAKGKKEGVKVDTKDDATRYVVKEDGSIYYETWGEDLYLTKGKSTGKKIASDVSEWYITKQAAYILDYDDTLFEAIGKGKPQKINNDVKELVRPIPNRYSLSFY